jgi:Histidine kinase-, DNA gyrase B-, and HSP90-like ATPase
MVRWFVVGTGRYVTSALSRNAVLRVAATVWDLNWPFRRSVSMPRRTTVIPSAARLMTSLRDIGYDLPSAIADLIDNSIDAGATTVQITVGRTGGASFIRIADDGCGMTDKVLDEAMRYGSRRAYEATDLGKFGLGLKTASLSQCRRLTVASRTTPSGRIRIRRWDLDHVRSRDAWELERLLPSECAPYLLQPLRDSPGTVVLWEKLDRILAYARVDGEHARRALGALSDSVAEHLAMVFHRFLSARAAGKRRLNIIFNGEPLAPWDPFARAERLTQKLPAQRLHVEHRGKQHALVVRPHVLPSQAQFSGPEAHALAAGPKKWNRQQGFYIYRADRMIQSGGWNRLRTTDEHSKLARIAIDVPAGLEELFQINVAKMRVVLPDAVRPQLSALAAGVVTLAQEAYRRRLRLIEGVGLDEATDVPLVDQGQSIGDVWPLIVDVLSRELDQHPELLDSVLLALANARSPGQGRGEAASSS